MANREHESIGDAKKEILEREQQNLEKWRRLYANNDPDWFYWDEQYYDQIINTFTHDKEETFQEALKGLHLL